MATHAQPSPPTGLHSHHAPPPPAAAVHAAQVNGQMAPSLQAQAPKTPAQHLASINEAVWLQIGEWAKKKDGRRIFLERSSAMKPADEIAR